MGFLKAIAEIILFYILFRVVVNFVIPAFRNISRMRKQFKQMQDHFNNQLQNYRAQQQNFNRQNDSDKVANNDGEYIDYEEVE